MLKKIILCLILALLPGTAAKGDDAVILHDTFLPDLERSFWFEKKSPASDWTLEKKLRISMDKLHIRPITGGQAVKAIEVIDAATGKTAWRVERFDRPAVSPPFTGSAEYIVRCQGAASKENIQMAVNAYKDNRAMPSWNLTNAQATFPDAGGMLLKTTRAGKPGDFNGRIIGITPGKFYEIEVALVSKQDADLSLNHVQRQGSRKIGSSTFKASGGVEHLWKTSFPGIASSVAIAVSFTDECLFKSVTVRQVEAPQQVRKSGSKTFYFEARNAEPDPDNAALKQPTVYRRNPRMVYEDSVPQDFEIIDKLDAFTTQGDYAVYFFTLYNPGEEQELDLLRISDLKNGDQVIASDTFKISHVGFWDYPRSPYNYYKIPELIQPQQKGVIHARENKLFWLQARLPDDCQPGVYTGSASVKCGGREITLPVRLRVLPFKLLTPDDMVWSVYSRLHLTPQRNYPMDLMVRYLQDMKDYGVTSLHHTVDSEAGIQAIQQARQRAGMDGPMIVYNSKAEQHAMRRVGVDPRTQRWFDLPQVREAFVDRIKEMDGWIRKYAAPGYGQWYYMGADEPHISLMELSTWQNRLAREAGVLTAACVYGPRYVAELAPYLNLSCNSFISGNANVHAELTRISRQAENLNYWYLGAGCYGGQEGGLMPNRLLSGFMCYKLGVKGHLSYTYQAYSSSSTGDAYDNFTAKSYAMTYPAPHPTPERVSVFTLEWEGVREGITDYKYLHTLETAIKLARAKGLDAQATAAQDVLTRIVSSIPYLDDARTANGITESRNFDNITAEQLRALAANAILKLHEAGVTLGQ